ncbi:unnamed protein product [Brachionus calyciflorus]|uniref:Reverse transcriptase domain-containing protein n=1 Tax=Brachionus calyciflorus TaxID=104777 RepID=A0A814GJC8_9BILA|nr:unnamed protein product [Brachionus calyciflorus]
MVPESELNSKEFENFKELKKDASPRRTMFADSIENLGAYVLGRLGLRLRKEKAAFTTPDGYFEFHRLPFGPKNGPSDYCRIMQMILGDLEFVEVYMDDITIHSMDFISHCKNIKKVLKRLKKANLKINPRKCKWFAKQIRLLRHIVSNKPCK